MKVDYPHDMSPEPMHNFSHPFPLVQDSEDFDKDFVKDENSDGGEWHVQEEYSKLRGRLAHAKHTAEMMQSKERITEERLKQLEAQERQARERAEEALRRKLAAEARAKGKLQSAEDAWNRAMGRNVSNDPIERRAASGGQRAVGPAVAPLAIHSEVSEICHLCRERAA